MAELPRERRKTIVESFGWTADRYETFLDPIFRACDPARYPGRADPARVIIFDAYYDECVKPGTRDALWKLMGLSDVVIRQSPRPPASRSPRSTEPGRTTRRRRLRRGCVRY
jgi:hypothetical protein